MTAGEALIDMIGSVTSNAVTSSARVLPVSFSADMKANRGRCLPTVHQMGVGDP